MLRNVPVVHEVPVLSGLYGLRRRARRRAALGRQLGRGARGHCLAMARTRTRGRGGRGHCLVMAWA